MCFFCGASAAFGSYREVLPKAGYLIAPSAVWISVATFLVYTIWRINPRPDGELEPLLPMK